MPWSCRRTALPLTLKGNAALPANMLDMPIEEAALESGESAPADCLILDIHLPGVSGFELLRRLALRGTEAPAIFITAHDDSHRRVEASRLGARGFLVKPFSGRELLEAVSEALHAET